jgi:hypothetical protein
MMKLYRAMPAAAAKEACNEATPRIREAAMGGFDPQ